MSIRFSRNPWSNRKQKSEAQQRQWKLFAALGYTIGIRGYLNCWRALLKAANITSPQTHGTIDMALAASSYIEKEIRYQIKHIPSSPAGTRKK